MQFKSSIIDTYDSASYKAKGERKNPTPFPPFFVFSPDSTKKDPFRSTNPQFLGSEFFDLFYFFFTNSLGLDTGDELL